MRATRPVLFSFHEAVVEALRRSAPRYPRERLAELSLEVALRELAIANPRAHRALLAIRGRHPIGLVEGVAESLVRRGGRV